MQEQSPENQFSVTDPPIASIENEQSETPYPVDQIIEWRADEYEHHDKNTAWYGAVLFGIISIAIVTYLISRDLFVTIIALLFAAVLVYASARKPREIQYAVSSDGIQVGGKKYLFSELRSFHVVAEEKSPGVILMPLKRFMPTIYISIPHDLVEPVADYIAQILPVELHSPEFIEKIIRRFHF